MKPLRLLALVLFLAPALYGQYWTKIDSVFSPSGVTPLSFSAPAFADLDGDGDADLILGSSSSRIEYYENIGTSTAARFLRDTSMFSSVYAGGYMNTNSDYPVVCDLNGDGRLDLVIGGFNGLLLYYNTGDTLQPVWDKNTSVFASIDSVIGTDAKPAFADLDGDGDLDLMIGIGESFFGGPTAGISMGFRNVGTPTAPQFVADSTLIAGVPDVGLNAYPTFRDVDGDSKIDLLMGRDVYGILYYHNTGTVNAPAWTATSSIFSAMGTSTYWNDPTFCDLDGDGDLDVIYGTSDGTLFYYQNTGTPTVPTFQYVPAFFAIIRIDGNGATASLADFDHDGNVDLVSGDWLGKFQYFHNEGTPSVPHFKKTTASFSSLDVGSYSAPSFVDLDHDGDIDIAAGALDGMIHGFINSGASFAANTALFTGIDAGYRSAAAFADIDADGDLDFVVGSEDADSFAFYRNNGQNQFTADTSLLAGISVGSDAHPAFVDIDGDGDYDLAIGLVSGNVIFYENTGTPQVPHWEDRSFVFDGVEVDQDAAPAFADMTGDGQPDLIVAEYNGNFSFYRNDIPASVRSDPRLSPDAYDLLSNYPNPFNPSTTFRFTVPVRQASNPGGVVSLRVFDLLGRQVALLVDQHVQPGVHTITWNAAQMPSGAYFCRMSAGAFSKTVKAILAK